MSILITGGCGYIGSHAAIALLEAGHNVVLFDSLINSSVSVLQGISSIVGRSVDFVRGDIRDAYAITSVIEKYDIKSVFHFAGLKSVAESQAKSLSYYSTNVAGTITLVEVMDRCNVRDLVFSSSATVYNPASTMPLSENSPAYSSSSVYGNTKIIGEQLLHNLFSSNERWSIAILRYFNPVGAHKSGLIGEMPVGTPNNLMPYVCQVAAGHKSKLSVYGSDYPTIDGTGVRDYIHIEDLVEGHLSAYNYIKKNKGVHTWNLGTGIGHSVLQVVQAFEKLNRVRVPYVVADRRVGDIAASWSAVAKARDELNWEAKRGIEQMVADAWQWYSRGRQIEMSQSEI